MIIGYGRSVITPSCPVSLAGFDLRHGRSDGSIDELYATAVLISGGDRTLLLVSLDLLGVSPTLRDMIRARTEGIAQLTLVCATHTHAAPSACFDTYADELPRYREKVADAVFEAAREAAGDLKECEMSAAFSSVEGVASLRDTVRESSAYAMPCPVIKFARGDGDILLCFYSCHATVLGEGNFKLCRDLPGGCEAAYTSHRGGRLAFFNGPCADLSTRFTRRAPDVSEIARIGKIWAEALKKSTFSPLAGHLTFTSSELVLPAAKYFSESEKAAAVSHIREKLAACRDDSQKREYISCLAVLSRKSYGVDILPNHVEIAAAAIGDTAVMFLPLELPSKDGDALRAEAVKAGKRSIVVCYCDGYEGYLPTSRPLDFDSGYEDIASPYDSSSKETVREGMIECLKRII